MRRSKTMWTAGFDACICRMKPLAEPAIAAVKEARFQIVPENRRQEYF